jgi:hypothetical protein
MRENSLETSYIDIFDIHEETRNKELFLVIFAQTQLTFTREMAREVSTQ